MKNNRSTALAGRIREVLLNGTWIANTNYQTQLEDVTYIEAIRKIEDLNTIALLTFHVNYYLNGLIDFFKQGELNIKDMNSFNCPEIENEEHWNQLKSALFANAEIFAKIVENLSQERLESVFVKPAYGSHERNIEGIIEHSYYHLGQISLLKKLIRPIGRYVESE